MSDWVLPATFVTLLAAFRPGFSSSSFANFRVLVAGWVHALGRHRISDVVRSAGTLASKHFCSYYRFFSEGRWSLDELGLTLLQVIVRVSRVKHIELVLDDTLSRRTGKKVALGTMHADPLLRYKGRPFHRYGHVFVILAVHVMASRLSSTGWALPFVFRLFESSKAGGRQDSPSDQKRAAHRRRQGLATRNRRRLTDREVRAGKLVACEPRADSGPLPEGIRPTKLQLAAQMVLVVARAFPDVHFRVLADHAYNGHALLHTVHSLVTNVSFVVRGQPDAALYTLPKPTPGRRGRPRTRGERLPTPAQWAATHRAAFRPVTVEIYGKQVPLKVASFVGMAYRTLPGRLVRYVLVQDPRRVYKAAYLMSTDPSLTAEQIVIAYSHRWPLELTIQETKQKLGMQHPQTQLPRSARRTAPFALLIYSLVVWWYITDGFQQARRLRPCSMPWYPKDARPSFTDMLAALRRLGWARGFLDPALRRTARSKLLQAYLNQVAAVA